MCSPKKILRIGPAIIGKCTSSSICNKLCVVKSTCYLPLYPVIQDE
jgi:hypothetical protein